MADAAVAGDLGAHEDCDVIAASMMSNSHLVLGPRLLASLRELGRLDIPVYMGGILPQEDIPKLKEAGVKECFTTGTGCWTS